MSRRALWSLVFLGLLVASLSINGLRPTAYGGWPAPGLVVAVLLLAGRRWHRTALAVLTVAIGVAITFGFDQSLWVGLVASVSITVPAVITWRLLGRPPDGRLRIEQVDNNRYHLAAVVSASVCAAIGGALVLFVYGPRDVPLTLLMTFSSSITAQLMILPLFLDSPGKADGRPAELWVQRVVLAVETAVVFWSDAELPLLFVVFAPLGWAAIRASRREAHIQLLIVCAAGYALTFLGHGPLAGLPAGQPDFVAPLIMYLFVATACFVIVPATLNVEHLSHMTRRAHQAASTMERLIDSAEHTMIIATDERGSITHYNAGAQQLLGYRPVEILGHGPSRFFAPGEVARQAAYFGVDVDPEEVCLAQARSGVRRDWLLRRADGEDRIVSMSVSEVTGPEGGVVGYIIAGEDITDRARAQEATRAALAREHASVRRLQEVDHVKQELVSNVSHELRTPITSISGYAELLSEGAMGELNDEQAQAVDRIRRNTSRLELLVEDLLTMSRAESGRLELNPVDLDLREVAREAFELLSEALHDRDLDVHLVLPPAPVIVHGDHHALERVVVNLMSNAVKFTPDRGQVVLQVSASSEGAQLIVSDTGLGIREEDQVRLFQRFFRAQEATDRAIQGTGLGLSIVHALVTQHAGTVSIQSRPGAGTTVTVSLPVVSTDDSTASQSTVAAS